MTLPLPTPNEQVPFRPLTIGHGLTNSKRQMHQLTLHEWLKGIVKHVIYKTSGTNNIQVQQPNLVDLFSPYQ